MVKGCALRGRYSLGDKKTSQHLEIRKDDKSNTVTTVHKDCLLIIKIEDEYVEDTRSD